MAGSDFAASLPGSQAEAEADSPLSGSVPQFAEIYRRYFDFIWASARRLGVSTDAIDDIVQEVFIVIHARLHTLQQPDSLRSWIYGVVRRTVSGYRRTRKTKEAYKASFFWFAHSRRSPQQTPYDLVEQNAHVELLSRLLAELDEAKREIFILVELEEMSVPEVAQALEIPLNTAYSRLRAARLAFEAGLARRGARAKEEGLP